MSITFWYRLVLICLGINISADVSAQSHLFSSQEPLAVEIMTDLRQLFNDTNPETAKYHLGILSYIDESGNSVNLKINLKTRGDFRRSKENCNFPPLWIKFVEDSTLEASTFASIKKLKLVNPCNRKNQTYQQYLVKEYYIYRMYNILTDYSYRVKFVKINFIDIGGRFTNFQSVGFFIEDIDALESRTNTQNIKTLGIIQNAINRPMMDLTSVFQYMIGNTDWSVPKQHNIKLILTDSVYSFITIPYDFDFCGFVDPPYTKPPEIIPIKHVTERYYRGCCRTFGELAPTIRLFELKKDSILNLMETDTILADKHKKRAKQYLNSFFKVIEDSLMLHREFIDNCKRE